ncbi:MAG: hypothetical protein ACOC98_11525 [Thermodesulfobacteriota bacterium]
MGEFAHDRIHGAGTIIRTDGTRYQSEFRRGRQVE